ncbi:HAD family hydrolase [Pelagibacterales bacterium SAG-MED41]|nr:HAD family hydrolase [Pelagibacterales bacterium SAG-MED41]|tara:strand:+ start:1834 stop:2457 length:624 start_codon:yes stop_codon:yes gene_type:complete
MKKFINKKLILLDLDGVLIKSLKNMELAWKSTTKKFSLNIKFVKYKRYIGIPFKDILKALKIKKKLYHSIEKEFKKQSIINLEAITFYPGVLKTLKNLKKKYDVGVLTSKDNYRTKKILNKLNFKFDLIQCPIPNLRGKPYPDLILKILDKLKKKKNEVIYVGDTKFDLMTCKAAKIDFILAKYGYKIGIKNYKFSINKFKDLDNFF